MDIPEKKELEEPAKPTRLTLTQLFEQIQSDESAIYRMHLLKENKDELFPVDIHAYTENHRGKCENTIKLLTLLLENKPEGIPLTTIIMFCGLCM